MNDSEFGDTSALYRRIHGELIDSLDEELELEIDDRRLAERLADAQDNPEPHTLDRRTDFRELLRLQRKLVKLRGRVVHQRSKVVILFEGRDAQPLAGPRRPASGQTPVRSYIRCRAQSLLPSGSRR